ncbi:Threonylcarbamoyl-AMP synthase [uncultured archaeon]|nr:Threonylcarbamoyl-AMP synthase [uncultured archaeon]
MGLKKSTRIVEINPEKFSMLELSEAVGLLREGKIVAFPTETVYGLGANAFDESAVKKIYLAKGRPSDNPIIVHVCDEEQLKDVVREVPQNARALIKKFWPGPLTIVLKKSPKICSAVTGGLDTVAVRMPSHKVALALIKECGFPLAAPSANSSGKPSPTIADHVFADLFGRIPLIIDGGKCEVGVESTVISFVGADGKNLIVPTLLRPGKVSVEEIEEVIGKINVPASDSKTKHAKKPLSPGMKYKHYSPKAEVVVVMPGKDFLKKVFEIGGGKDIGVLSFTKRVGVDREFFFDGNVESYAKMLFEAFREFDNKGVELILAEGVSEKGMGLALMDRLKRASSKII